MRLPMYSAPGPLHAAGEPAQWAPALATLITAAGRLAERTPRFLEDHFSLALVKAIADHISCQHDLSATARTDLRRDLRRVATRPVPDARFDRRAPHVAFAESADLVAVAQRIARQVDFTHFGVQVRRVPGGRLRAAQRPGPKDWFIDLDAPALGLAGLADPNAHYNPDWCLLTPAGAEKWLRKHDSRDWTALAAISRVEPVSGQSVPPGLCLRLDDWRRTDGAPRIGSEVMLDSVPATVGALRTALESAPVAAQIAAYLGRMRGPSALASVPDTPLRRRPHL